MTSADVPLGMRLCAQAGFNQTPADWRRFLGLEPEGCFVAELDGQPVGTVVNFVFGGVGWIAMLLVDERVRRRGIGTRLMEHALLYLDGRGVRTARLDATPRGRLVYEKLDFVAEYGLVRMEGVGPSGATCEAVRPVAAEQLPVVLELDRQVTGTDRSRLIRRLHEERPDAMHAFHGPRGIRGYLALREGTNALQIGPGVAMEEEAGRALGDALLARSAGRPVFVDVPIDNASAIEWAESKGLVVQRPFTRMRRGEPVVDRPSQLWASSGPEKG